MSQAISSALPTSGCGSNDGPTGSRLSCSSEHSRGHSPSGWTVAARISASRETRRYRPGRGGAPGGSCRRRLLPVAPHCGLVTGESLAFVTAPSWRACGRTAFTTVTTVSRSLRRMAPGHSRGNVHLSLRWNRNDPTGISRPQASQSGSQPVPGRASPAACWQVSPQSFSSHG